jgi:hypothetical protein
MKKTSRQRRHITMRAEYDFSKGVRGKYAERCKDGADIAVLATRSRKRAKSK